MEIKIAFNYRESSFAGKRHTVKQCTDGLLIGTVPELTAELAPLAIVKIDESSRVEYRFYAGRLWAEAEGMIPQAEVSTSEPASTLEAHFARCMHNGDRDQCTNQLTELLSQMVIIDGRIHIQAEEPFYHVMTFGLGFNHGSTALVVGTNRSQASSCFSILDYPAAKQYAEMVAKNRSQVDRLSMPDEVFEVHIPEALAMPRRPYLDDSFDPTDRAGLKVVRGEYTYRMHFAGALEAYYQGRAEAVKQELLNRGWCPDEDGSFTHDSKPEVLISVDAGKAGDANCVVVQEPSSVPGEYRTIAEIFDLTDAPPADLVAAAIAVS